MLLLHVLYVKEKKNIKDMFESSDIHNLTRKSTIKPC